MREYLVCWSAPDPPRSPDLPGSSLVWCTGRRWRTTVHVRVASGQVGDSSGALEQGAEVIEVVGGIVRAWRGLWVVLDAEHRAVEQA